MKGKANWIANQIQMLPQTIEWSGIEWSVFEWTDFILKEMLICYAAQIRENERLLLSFSSNSFCRIKAKQYYVRTDIFKHEA